MAIENVKLKSRPMLNDAVAPPFWEDHTPLVLLF